MIEWMNGMNGRMAKLESNMGNELIYIGELVREWKRLREKIKKKDRGWKDMNKKAEYIGRQMIEDE